MASTMTITMDTSERVSVTAEDGLLTINDDDDEPICISINQAEEFINNIRTVVEFHNNQQQKGSKDADSHAQEE